MIVYVNMCQHPWFIKYTSNGQYIDRQMANSWSKKMSELLNFTQSALELRNTRAWKYSAHKLVKQIQF